MSSSYVTDTMALVLRLETRRMGQEAKTIFENAEKKQIDRTYYR